jgi:hypothetical protein
MTPHPIDSHDHEDDLLQEASMFLIRLFIAAIGVCYIVSFTVGTGTNRSRMITTKALACMLFVILLNRLIQAAISLPPENTGQGGGVDEY